MYNKWVNKIIICFLVILVCINILYANEEVEALEKKGENLIRFHVLANSDSPEDQELKLKVRDKVIEDMSMDLEKSSAINETREIIKTNLSRIKRVAEEEIKRNGKNFNVKVSLEEHKFPTKRYGNVIFPAGIYEALRIEIGKAEGQNWWCVMFPPLCFVDVKNGLTDEKTKKELENNLTKEEYHLVYNDVNGNELPLKLKSKLVEVIEGSKEQFARLTSVF